MSSRNGIRIEHGPGNAVYLDHAATTPADPQVIAAMNRCLGIDGVFGNAETGASMTEPQQAEAWAAAARGASVDGGQA